MTPNRTCSACRTRKVRCDGELPKCGPCQKARKPIECEYTQASAVAATPKGEYLKKGAACAPCRRKKKKCDANRPYCSTCKTAGKEKECTYDESPNATEALVMQLQQRLAAYEGSVQTQQYQSDNSLMVSHVYPEQPMASTSRLPSSPPLTFVQDAAWDVPLHNLPFALHVFSDRLKGPSPTTDLYHLGNPHIASGPEEFRRTFSEHALQYGCALTGDKMQAILSGDRSGTVVHPAWIYIAQLHGCLLWQHDRHMSVFGQLELEQLQLLFGAMEHIDPVTEIQIRYILACYYLLKQQMEAGNEQLILAADIVHRNKLNFPTPLISVDPFDPLQIQDQPEVTEYQRELINAISHLMYLDRCSAFVFRGALRLEKSYDEAFKTVADMFPILAKSNLVYLRTRSLLLYMRVAELESQWVHLNGPGFIPQRTVWFDSYWPLLAELTAHAANLESLMLRSSFESDRMHAVTLKFCQVVALSGKAQMHWFLHRTHPESHMRALDVVMEIVGITRTFKDTEFMLLDPLLGLCWSAIVKIVREAITVSSTPQYPREISWVPALQTIDVSAKKLGYEIPFMDESLQVISEVISVVT